MNLNLRQLQLYKQSTKQGNITILIFPTIISSFKGAYNNRNITVNIENTSEYQDYLQSIRNKIGMVADSLSRNSNLNGDITLSFILFSDGSLSSVEVIGWRSSGDKKLQELAKEAVKKASPFEPFPAALSSEKLSFAVTLSFD